MSRVKKYLLVVAALLIIMYFVNPPTDKKKIEPSTTNRFIEKSSTVKEKTEPSTTNRVVEERNEAIGEPIFEIRPLPLFADHTLYFVHINSKVGWGHNPTNTVYFNLSFSPLHAKISRVISESVLSTVEGISV